MSPKEINDYKKEHNRLLEEGQRLYAQMLKVHEKCTGMQEHLKIVEGDDYDGIPLIFGAGFWIDPSL